MAASNVNVVVVTGNLTRDPGAAPAHGGGTSVCKLRVVVNSRRKDGQTGEWIDKPNYFDVTVWGAQGEELRQLLLCAAGRWRSRAASTGASGRKTASNARASRSSPTRSSSSARATRSARAVGGQGRAASAPWQQRRCPPTPRRLRRGGRRWRQDDDIPF